ncbi:MAG: Rrf2 family transcriptional regulator [Candidatus Omnitrophica bacterium]|nr:Rrf2 family transcriptional regulator [Candidatus Omnitrophota bacterium]MDD5237916.1 Rrf2 family transcriptional regulator [Candidatus Omnitrophota bacterium]
MKLITRDTDYAVRALTYIANHKDKTISVSELVEALRIPRPFLRKILQILNKKRILKSLKGQGGGFNLAITPDKIFIADLMEIFQGPLKINECIFKKRICPGRNLCILKMKIDTIEDYVIKQLRSISLEVLL